MRPEDGELRFASMILSTAPEADKIEYMYSKPESFQFLKHWLPNSDMQGQESFYSIGGVGGGMWDDVGGRWGMMGGGGG